MRRGTFADSDVNPYDESATVLTTKPSKEWIHPFNAGSTPKRSFIPSKWERLKVSKFVQALKKGWMKPLA